MSREQHPLQPALDRATAATYTVVDLLDIARDRKPTAPASGREGRPDARQASLYKAAIASSVAAIEETFEAFATAGLQGLGTPPRALNRLSTAIAKSLQSPNPQNLANLLQDYLGFDPRDHWAAHLSHSPAAYRQVKRKDADIDYKLLYTAYSRSREFTGSDLSNVVGRFVKIRNSFAHQDTSSIIFTKPEQDGLRTLRQRPAASSTEIEFVESISTTCAVTLDAKSPQDDDPVVKWTVHETHAVNSLLMYIGLVISTCNALADHLETTGGISLTDFDRLTLRVQDGRWMDWGGRFSFGAANVDFELTEYRPSSRE